MQILCCFVGWCLRVFDDVVEEPDRCVDEGLCRIGSFFLFEYLIYLHENLLLQKPVFDWTGDSGCFSFSSRGDSDDQPRITWSGRFGKYNVQTTVVPGKGKGNHMYVPVGDGRAFVINEVHGDWPSERPGWSIAHETGHLLGLRDGYDRKTNIPFTPEDAKSIMGKVGMPPQERDIERIVNLNGGVTK